jgi:hypothetical protein
MRDLRRDPLMLRETAANEALEDAVVQGYRKFDGDFELQVRPAQGDGPASGSTVANDSPL